MAGISSNSWQVAAASVVLPLNALAGSPAFLSSVAFLGASALLVGVSTTCWYGFSVTSDFWGNVAALPWFTSPQGLTASLSHTRAPSCAGVRSKRGALPPVCRVPGHVSEHVCAEAVCVHLFCFVFGRRKNKRIALLADDARRARETKLLRRDPAARERWTDTAWAQTEAAWAPCKEAAWAPAKPPSKARVAS